MDILHVVSWLGFCFEQPLFASDFFDFMYRVAQRLIERCYSYVDNQSAEHMRASRSSFTETGRDSPYRGRPPAESLALFRQMKAGAFPDGAHVLRARIDMASPNLNLRDPVLYRIRHAEHHRTGGK